MLLPNLTIIEHFVEDIFIFVMLDQLTEKSLEHWLHSKYFLFNSVT